MKLHLVNLGCVRNLVDSEIMLGRLKKANWTISDDPAEAEVIIINTCGFIINAIEESIDTILELAKFKESGICRRLVVTGCLPERFQKDIVESLPEVDAFLGTGAYDQIVAAVEDRLETSKSLFPDPNRVLFPQTVSPRVLSIPHTAYVKVAEGCDRHCSYCIIPQLRGRQRSRPPEQIVAEAASLISSGVKEIILVAENTTDYGRDLNPPLHLSGVMRKIAGISKNLWLRVLYGHPESMDDAFIAAMAEHENICSYFDLPIQHASSKILKKMGRTYSRDDLYCLYDKIRNRLPNAALRTTVIVGFPGETERDFDDLMTFIEDIRFDHLGVFTYSDSEDLASHHLGEHVSHEVAEKRHDRLMARQAQLSLEKNKTYLGKTVRVLVEESPEEGLYLGRTAFQAPEVDGLTFIYSAQLPIGEFVDVKIRDAYEYDLVGDPA